MTVSQYLTETRIFAGVCLYSSLQRRVNIDNNEAVDTGIQGGGDWMTGRASNEGSRRFYNHGEVPCKGLLLVESTYFDFEYTVQFQAFSVIMKSSRTLI